MFEFDTNFNVNTGDLESLYIGSGVHLYKDVTLSFSLIDPMGQSINSDSELISNSSIDGVIFDILDTGRNIIYPNYISGLTRSVTITERDNINIFGLYTPNFGVKASVINSMNLPPFISEFYVYGNVPSISNYRTYGSSGVENYSQSNFWKFNLQESLLTGFNVKTISTGDIRIIWSDDPNNFIPDSIYSTGSGITYFSTGSNFIRSNSNLVTADISGHNFITGNVITINGISSPIDFNGTYPILNISGNKIQYNTTGIGYATGIGLAQIQLTPGACFYSGNIVPNYDQILLNHQFNNNIRYINIEKYDVYASDLSFDDITLYDTDLISASENKNFIYSIKRESYESLHELKISPIGLEYNKPYYFKVVPYSSIGTGQAMLFGPEKFESPSIPEVTTGFIKNQIDLLNGDSSMKLDFITGKINTSGVYSIDIIERGTYNTICYTTQIIDANNTVYSSELKLVDTYLSSIGSGISFSEYAISANNNILYSVQNDNSYIYLNISGVIPDAIYKLYRTLI